MITIFSGRRSLFDAEDSDCESIIESPSTSTDDHKTGPEELLGAVEEIISLLFHLSVEIHDEISNPSKPQRTRLSALQASEEDLKLVVEAFPHASVGLCERLAATFTARHARLNKTVIHNVEEHIEEPQSEVSSTLSDCSAIDHADFVNLKHSFINEWQKPNFACPFCFRLVSVTSERHWR